MTVLNARTLSGDQVRLDEETVRTFSAGIRGTVLRQGDDGYDAARRIWNGMIDRYPALIVRCRGTADVIASVNFARELSMRVSVKGGGHNVAGSAVSDGGMMIELSGMNGVHVDPARRTASVQPGATWADFDRETQLFGLVTPGGEVSTTGVAGFTLAGGMGMVRRKWGLTCDNLRSAQVVTADGNIVIASEAEHPDLLWALRGGGGNFGVVTSFELTLHPLGPEVYVLAVIYPFDDAAAICRQWRRYSVSAPDEVASELLFWGMPALPDLPSELHGQPIVLINGMYAGPASKGVQAFRPLLELGTPLLDLSGPADYARAQGEFDAFFPNGALYYWKSLFIDDLTDDIIGRLIAWARERPSPETLIAIRHLGGAIARVPETASAYGNRHATFNVSFDSSWSDPAASEHAIGWTRRAWQQLQDLTGGGVYLNFAGLGEDNDALARSAYGENYARLKEVKRRYDPGNLFRSNVNITP